LGAWPLVAANSTSLTGRLQAYAVKATREAMVHTRWTRPNLRHEQALQRFVASILKPGSNNRFLRTFSSFQEQVAYYGMINGLSQVLLKISSPGIPDFYQGSELWDLRLVDPDNRQPVDFDKRAAALDSIAHAGSVQALHHLSENWRDGCVKLYLIWKTIPFP